MLKKLTEYSYSNFSLAGLQTGLSNRFHVELAAGRSPQGEERCLSSSRQLTFILIKRTVGVNFQKSVLRTSHSPFKVGIPVTIVGAGPSFFSRKEVPNMLGQCPGAPDSELLSQHTKTVWCSWLLLVSARIPGFHAS